MSDQELPEGWQDVSLEELAAPTPGSIKIGPFGSSLKKADLLTDGPYKVYGQENILSGNFTAGNRFIDSAKWNELRSCELSPGDVCITMMGSLGGSRIVPANIYPGVMDSHLLRIRPNLQLVAPDYLVVFLRGSPPMNRQLEESAHGSIMDGLNASIVRSLRIPLAPLPEQKRIVAKVGQILARVNAGRERLDRVPKIMKRFRQAVLAAACSGRLTEGWREERSPDKENWRTVVLSDVGHLRLGKMLDKEKNVGEPTPYLRNTNVRWFGFDLSDVATMRATLEDKKQLTIKDGDLFVCEGGEPGRCAVWEAGETDMVFQKAIHRVRPGPALSSWWLAVSLKNDADSGRLEDYFTGSTIKHLTGRSLAQYEFPLPVIAEQEEIVRRVESLFKLADAIEKRMAAARLRADKLTQSILAKAFRGELVPTEAQLARREGRSYEPASVLLERIRAEREKGKPQAKKGRKGA